MPTKTRETDAIQSKRPWAFTIHSENSKDWISFPSTNKTLGIRENESHFHHLAFEPAQKALENVTVKNAPEMLRGKVSCSQVAIIVKLFVYHIQLLYSFSGFYITYYVYFLEAVITSHVHFDFTYPEFSYENYIYTKTCSCDYPFQAN